LAVRNRNTKLLAAQIKPAPARTQPQQPKQEEVSSSKYKKEPLPTDFSYKVIEDKSNDALEKNELTLEINKKISVEQIATLADKLFSTKKGFVA
jgi:hypothetical protein